jgi:hypothetical protein
MFEKFDAPAVFLSKDAGKVIFRGGIRSLMNIQQWRTLESSVLKKALVLGRRDGADHDKARKRTKL